MPEASVPSRFLEEVPPQLVEELGGSRQRASSAGFSRAAAPSTGGQGRSVLHRQRADPTHYSYEDEDQSAALNPAPVKPKTAAPLPDYNSTDNIPPVLSSPGQK